MVNVKGKGLMQTWTLEEVHAAPLHVERAAVGTPEIDAAKEGDRDFGHADESRSSARASSGSRTEVVSDQTIHVDIYECDLGQGEDDSTSGVDGGDLHGEAASKARRTKAAVAAARQGLVALHVSDVMRSLNDLRSNLDHLDLGAISDQPTPTLSPARLLPKSPAMVHGRIQHQLRVR
jgi:hypothetical protein